MVAVFPWLYFNQESLGEDVNLEVFPFSTMALILAVGSAFSASTLWPLYRSIFQVGAGHISTLSTPPNVSF